MQKQNILVIGSGGREHAILCAMKKSPLCGKLYAAPGNGGIAKIAECINCKATDIDGILKFLETSDVDLVFVAPDDPLMLGMVDRIEEKGIRVFGPRQNAAIIEGSKVFSKDLMKKYNIPTAGYEVFENPADVIEYIKSKNTFPTVIKAEGLALGKGVIIAEDMTAAEAAVKTIMEDKIFGASGNRVVVEEFLTGPEVSVLAFCDGKNVVPMVSAQDHKRAFDHDKGPNTGGMGTFSPSRVYTPDIAEVCMDTIFRPTVAAMAQEGRPFKGCLYFGLMLTKDGPKVIEYNCRFGDPETQVVLPLLESDLLTVMQAVTEERLSETEVKFSDKNACCVIMASKGYPESYGKGYPISIPDSVADNVYVAGAALKDGAPVTSGGRVLGVTAIADTLPEAIEASYKLVGEISFENSYCRSDIGARALKALEVK